MRQTVFKIFILACVAAVTASMLGFQALKLTPSVSAQDVPQQDIGVDGTTVPVQDVPLTIRIHYNSQEGVDPTDGSRWPRLAVFLNNGGNYENVMDNADCSKPDRPSSCGTPNLFQTKLIGDFEATGATGTHDLKVSASKFLARSGDNYFTKISIAYHNDYWNPGADPVIDRNVAIRRVQILDPEENEIMEFIPRSLGNTKFYFNMGIINMQGTKTIHQDGMNRAFDRGVFEFIDPTTGEKKGEEPELIFDHLHSDFDSINQNQWKLGREGSFNIVTRDLGPKIIEKFPAGQGGGGTETLIIRTHFQATEAPDSSDNSRWPRVAMFLNAGDNYDGSNEQPDLENCANPTGGTAACGTPPTYTDKMLEDFEVNTATFVRNTAVTPERMVHDAAGTPVTKLTYAYPNDYWNPGLSADRNVFITKIEILDSTGQKFYEFTPNRSASPSPQNTRPNAFYFNMGVHSMSDFQPIFDRDLIFTNNTTEFSFYDDTRWSLEREGSFNVVSFDLARYITQNFLNDGLAGDLNNSCAVDIYDYNLALQNFGSTTSQVDVDTVIANFGKKCQ